MATITGAQNERVFQIKKWLGLNENPDGDTKLKMGEATAQRNWRVTRDGNLQKRPGTKEILTVGTGSSPVSAVWNGYIGGSEYVLAVSGSTLYRCWDESHGWQGAAVGSWSGATAERPHMFGFADKLYLLTGEKYFCWDGATLAEVEGYIPLVQTATPPTGGGETLEQVNKLTAKRRVWFSPDGSAKTFTLPESGLASIDYAKYTANGNAITISGRNLSAGTLTLSSAPAAGSNTVEVGYTAAASFRGEITAMRFSETYNGTQDTRVFLYGDGSSRAIYSGLDYDGNARADYFPDLNEVRIGVANTPITGMIRHYSRLIAFKTDGAYAIQYGVITLADESLASAFYVTPINRSIGNDAPGQVQLVLNSPVTLFGSDLYEWRNNSSYSSNLSTDERQAKRISDRVYAALHGMTAADCIAYDDNYNQEYYLYGGDGSALVWNYAADAWYLYTNFRLHRPFSFHGELFFGSEYGGIQRVSTDYAYDQYGSQGTAQVIDCYWESGAMSFGQDYQRKYAAMLWLGMKPESKASVTVTVQTDRSSSYTEKVVTSNLAAFSRVNFADWTFKTNRKPQMARLKIKAKKFVFYKLILMSETGNTMATVTSADIRVRFTGFAK